MTASPFTFFRGAAAVMAYDLAATPTTGLEVQVCGDAHLLNFGLYATPERRLVFGANDFDETIRGPWEWDLKRLAASIAVAARTDGMDDNEACSAVAAAARFYRLKLREYATMRGLDVWYSTVDVGRVDRLFVDQQKRTVMLAARKAARRARLHDSIQALSKLTDIVDSRHVIRHEPPLILRVEEQEVVTQLRAVFEDYLNSLPEERRFLVRRYALTDLAMKVVGVGSVGTRCWIGLFTGGGGDGGADGADPLFLQVKEALPSVLETYLPASPYQRHGQRVVVGQRMMQAFPDIFLGWAHDRRSGCDYYVRQLRDMKGSFDVDAMKPNELQLYSELCGWALARAHARSGDAAAISGYLGTKDVFDRAVGAFAIDYADQNQADYETLLAAVADGRIEALQGV